MSEGGAAATRSVAFSPEFQAALQMLQAGQWPEAEVAFQQVLKTEPQNVVAWNCLGIIAGSQRQWRSAIRCYDRALALRPDFAEAHSNLGNARRALADWDAAGNCYRRALKFMCQLAEAHNGLGTCHLQVGELSAAADCFQRALDSNSHLAEVWNNLGNVRVAQGSADLALACFQQALALAANAEVYCNLGNALRELGQLEQAIQAYERAVNINGNLPEAWNNLGVARAQQRAIPAAIACYQEAVRQCPDRVEFLINLAATLARNEQFAEAESALDQVIAKQPDQVAYQLRRNSLCPAVFPDPESMQRWREEHACYWQTLADSNWQVELETLDQVAQEAPFNLQFLDGNLRSLKCLYARLFETRLPQFDPPINRGEPRVGFVVTRGHEGVFLKSLGMILQRLPGQLAEWVVFRPTESVERLRQAIGEPVRFLGLRERFAAKVEQLRSAQCDVLCYFEVGTDSTNYFLPMLRLAKVQCTTWGIQVTSGLANVGYYLSGRLVESDEAEQHYAETLLLAETLLTIQRLDGADRFRADGRALTCPPRDLSRSQFELRPDDHAYVCGQHLGKFHPDFDQVLGSILQSDDRGQILITSDESGISAGQLKARLQRSIPEVVGRVRFVPHLAAPAYYQLLTAADVLLDPPHFGGVNSTYDGLIVNQPIVTLPSPFQRGRYTLGCYRKLDYLECVATSESDYVRRAVRLGTDADYRDMVRREIQMRRERLFDDGQAATEFELLFGILLQNARGDRRS